MDAIRMYLDRNSIFNKPIPIPSTKTGSFAYATDADPEASQEKVGPLGPFGMNRKDQESLNEIMHAVGSLDINHAAKKRQMDKQGKAREEAERIATASMTESEKLAKAVAVAIVKENDKVRTLDDMKDWLSNVRVRDVDI